MRALIIIVLLLPLLTACETVQKSMKDFADALEQAGRPEGKKETKEAEPAKPRRAGGEAALAAGITQYEEGNYGQAQRLLQTSLADGLATPALQAQAYKHLAFIYCVTDRIAQCRQEFSNALKADPGFTLSPAEAGHPGWGPVFRSVKGH